MGNDNSKAISTSISLGDDFNCGICHNALVNPVIAENCEHMFCKSCTENRRESTNGHIICPTDNQRITALKPLPKPFLNLINAFALRCEFYFAGCKASFTGSVEMEKHKKCCEYNPEFSKACRNSCGAILRNKDIEGHNCIPYLKGIIKQLEEYHQEEYLRKEELILSDIASVKQVLQDLQRMNNE